MPWYYLVGIGLLNALGYIIFRASETQRCEFAKDPSSAKAEGMLYEGILIFGRGHSKTTLTRGGM